ncbi:CAMK protein kinase [Phytophthora nicotianae INRA-310]|uniref:CAMK protein kinase n=1 Tax=Phytophthora nicotianae (strain INRA-310) TaxID=761204 RepID=W2R868_PHYN3|nr:CAMK protein kinase [Phytophthora nicotianae INRA-310]ETN20884.1 CAMK protein kinase [Phytophthora nicotianae INRA-310]
MRAAGVCIRRVLRTGGNGVLARVPARTGLNLEANLVLAAESGDLEYATRFCSRQWSHAAGEESAGSWSNKLAVGSAVAAITALTSSESRCEVLEKDGGESRDDESLVRRGSCNFCEDDGDSMSSYFDTEYEPKKLLGCGTFGVVMLCVHKQTGRVAAVKMVQEIAGNTEEVEREKMALERLERAGGHETIVSYEGSYYHNDFHYIVVEYVPGTSLHSFVEKHHTLNATWSLQLVSQLASALQFMHQQDIVHRDLKPENIMALVNDNNKSHGNDDTEDVTLKIIDFGCAGRASQPESPRTSTLSGTRCYWPPEALECQDMTSAMDMWALGCILYILISGRHPFDLTGCSTEDEVMRRIKAEPVSFLLPVWHDVPAETKELIRGLLEKDPRHRLSADQVLEHPAIIAATKEL